MRALASRVLGVYVARHAEAALPRLLAQYRAAKTPDAERLALAEAFRSMLAAAPTPSPPHMTPLVAVLADAAVDASTVVRTSALAVLAAAAASAHLRPDNVAALRPALITALATPDADTGQGTCAPSRCLPSLS